MLKYFPYYFSSKNSEEYRKENWENFHEDFFHKFKVHLFHLHPWLLIDDEPSNSHHYRSIHLSMFLKLHLHLNDNL